jgi:hypothetical protein
MSRLRVLRKIGLAMLLSAGLALSSPAASRKTTGDQLEKLLAAATTDTDAELAQKLASIELSERFGPARLARCEASLPGPLSRQAFLAVADMAAFLDPAPGDVPALPKPDVEAQRKMIAAVVDYVTKTMHQLPNFFATRLTTSFQDDSWFQASPENFSNYKPLRATGQYSSSVLYRQGKEVVSTAVKQAGTTQAGAKQGGSRQAGPTGLTTSGEFGPILVTAVLDATQGKLYWSHWEQGVHAPMAIFRFAVSATKSHYTVEDRLSEYSGEIAVDPADGTIWWVNLRTVRAWNDPLAKVDLRVEYGPVKIGDKIFICPTKGTEVSVVRQLQMARASPVQVFLNHVVFEDYHVYQAHVRIVGGTSVVPSNDQPEAVPPQTSH